MSSCIATQIPHAVGIAMAMKIKKTGAVCLGFLGDGATSEGDFHVAMNFAAVFKAPVILICQNNHWAITVPSRGQSATETFAEKALAYGMSGVRVDGNDCLAVHEATRRACERARAGEGPTFIEAVTYRLLAHSTSDDPTRYRNPAEVEPWKAKDPILRMRRFLESRGLWDEAKERELENRTRDQIDTAIAKGEAAGPPELSTLFEDVFARPTPELERQRNSLLSRESRRETPG
jgi:pyruvate dehydrogenase E1 component alpha subunit/2-oxoisovalerate dehydrogenase E1 component alpha subunit